MIFSATLLIGVVAAAASAGIRVAWPRVAPWLAQVEPEARTRWLFALLATPVAMGGVVLVLAAAPCVAEQVAARDCSSFGDLACRFCLIHPAPTTAFARVVALLMALPLAVRALWVGFAAIRLQRALRAIQVVARRDSARDLWAMPGRTAFSGVSGEVFVGETLEHSLAPSAFDAVAAHEHAHVRRRDLVLKMAARVLAGTHLPGVSKPLVAALDLALEQACDIEASEAVRDPLIVAQALIDVTRLQHDRTSEGLTQCGSGVLEARVEALCNPSWVPSRAALLGVSVTSLAALVVGCAATQRVHHAADVMFTALTR